MRFKVDENIHPEIAELLRATGHDALTVWDQSMQGRVDQELSAACRQEGRAIVTLDLGFADIRAYPPATLAGVIVLRAGKQGRRSVRRLMQRVMPMFETETLLGRLWIVDDVTVRVRSRCHALPVKC